MDKLKKVFSPGSKHDDEVLYGDADERRASASASTSQQQPEQLHAVEGAGKKEHGILRQIINPGGDKYDDQRYGTTATTEEPDPTKLRTDPEAEKKDHTILRQVLNPNNDKYDEQRFGETAATGGDRQSSVPVVDAAPVVDKNTQLQTDPGEKSHSIMRQIVNPHGEKYDQQAYGTTAQAVGDADQQAGAAATSSAAPSQGTPALRSQTQGNATPGSCLSVKSGVEGPFARRADSPSAGVGATAQTLPDRTATSGDHSDLSRDAALAAGGASAAGAAGYIAANQDKPGEKITDRAHPLSGASSDAPSAPVTDSTITGPHAVGPPGGAHINPVGAPEESLTSGGSAAERDAVVDVGSSSALGAAASTQLNSAPADVQNATYTERAYPVGGGYHHTKGPHQTDIANVLDPHVPGEFPGEGGLDRHATTDPPLGPVVASDEPAVSSDSGKPAETTIVGTIASAVGLGGLVGATASTDRSGAATEPAQPTSATTHPGGASYPIQTTTNTLPSAPVAAQSGSGTGTGQPAEKSDEHQYGKDAAIAAGVAGSGAAAGYGVHEASKHHEPADSTPGTVGQSSQQAATETSTATATTSEHHYGRDAAVAGGAGAAGYGVYEATKDGQGTGPASKTIGPHESNAANIVDPRVQPDPEQMKESKTVGPHRSDLANKADPRVQSDPAKAKEENLSRDAAIAGGAAAAGAGAGAVASQKASEEETKRDGSEKSSEKGEKKHGLLHRILHPGRKDKDEKEEQESRKSSEQPQVPPQGSLNHPLVTSEDIDNRVSTDDKGHNKLHKKSVEQPRGYDAAAQQSSHIGTDGAIGRDSEVSGKLDPTADRPDEYVIEPHTGLPMNIGKFGEGSGGTDGATQIAGYHETDPVVRKASVGTAENAGTKLPSHQPGEEGVAGPDWDAIKKANTPY